MRELATDYAFLFADAREIVVGSSGDLIALIKIRIADHQQAVAKQLEIDRQRIRQEEEAKAEAKAKREAEAKVEAEAKAKQEAESRERAEAEARILGESSQKQATAPVPVPVPVPANDTTHNSVDLRAIVIEHQGEVRAFLATRPESDEKKQSIRPWLMEFVKFQAAYGIKKVA